MREYTINQIKLIFIWHLVFGIWHFAWVNFNLNALTDSMGNLIDSPIDSTLSPHTVLSTDL